MLSVKGIFKNGVARPSQDVQVQGREGQAVIITFLDNNQSSSPAQEADAAWTQMMQLVDECAVETGVSDLAAQHDHYLYNKPKKG
jgi:hypothetical protein